MQKAMGAPIDVTCDCVGVTKSLTTSLNVTRSAGCVCIVGMRENDMTLPITPAASRYFTFPSNACTCIHHENLSYIFKHFDMGWCTTLYRSTPLPQIPQRHTLCTCIPEFVCHLILCLLRTRWVICDGNLVYCFHYFLVSGGDVFRLVRNVMLLLCMAHLTMTVMTHKG